MQSESPQSQSPKQKVLCSFGADVTQGAVRPFEYQSLRAFAGWLKNLPAVREKITASYIVGATFESSKRTLTAMRGATIIQLDFDSPASADQRGAVCAALENLNIGFVCMDSFSNGGKFVVLIPLAHPASPAEHRATMEYIVGELGLYAAGLDPASYNPVLPRFVSPNANSPEREITLHDGPFIVPVAAKEGPLPANVASIAPIPAKQDRFALYTSQGEPEHKELFLVALRNKLLPTDRCDNYNRWFPVLFAGFRAWAINSRDLTESQRVLLEALNVWSASDPKYVKGCVEQKLGDWLRDGDTGQKLHIHSLLSHEIDSGRLRTAINEDNDLDLDQKITLIRALDKLVGTPVITVIDSAVAEAAATERAREVAEINAVKANARTILQRMPAPTSRFSEFRDLVTEVVSQGRVCEHWQLGADETFFLSPVPVVMTLVQMAALGFTPHTLLSPAAGRPPSPLVLWFLHVARQATGKSEVHRNTQPALDKTVFRYSYHKDKCFSATGLWTKFERAGNLQLAFSDEAESLFGKGGHIDGNLVTLHTTSKQLKDEGRPDSYYQPNTQVQRQVMRRRAPTLMYNLAGTYALLKDIPADMWIDGFISRFACIYLNPADPSTKTEEEVLAEMIEALGNKSAADYSVTIDRIATFLNRLWLDGNHPQGKNFFDMQGEIGGELGFDDLVERVIAHFETTDKARHISICDPDDEDAKRKFALLFHRYKQRWSAPEDSPHAEVFGSIAARSVPNLQVFAAVLSLIANPRAEYIDYELAVWAEDFLYHAQIGLYDWLKHRTEHEVPVTGKLRFEGDRLAQLRKAIEPGGLLYDGTIITATALRNKYRPWRRLIEDLTATGEVGKETRTGAELILHELGVQVEKQGKGLVFSMKPQKDIEA